MTYDRPHFYLTFGGTLYPSASQGEQWSTGFRFTNNEVRPVEDFVGALTAISVEDILEDCTELLKPTAHPSLLWSSNVTMDWAKLAVLDRDGRYAAAPKMAEQTPVGGGSSNAVAVPQLAAAVSTWSGKTFGRANRGRCYLPCPASFVSATNFPTSDPRVTAAHANMLRDEFVTWLGKVNGEIGTVGLPTFPAIMSKLGTGTTNAVVYVGVGRVIDTMRSRRQALDEAPTWIALP